MLLINRFTRWGFFYSNSLFQQSQKKRFLIITKLTSMSLFRILNRLYFQLQAPRVEMNFRPATVSQLDMPYQISIMLPCSSFRSHHFKPRHKNRFLRATPTPMIYHKVNFYDQFINTLSQLLSDIIHQKKNSFLITISFIILGTKLQ